MVEGAALQHVCETKPAPQKVVPTLQLEGREPVQLDTVWNPHQEPLIDAVGRLSILLVIQSNRNNP